MVEKYPHALSLTNMIIAAVLAFYYAQINSGNITPTIIQDYAIAESIAAGLTTEQVQEVKTVIKAESGFNPTKIHYNDGKVGCNSVGLVQIRSCDHDVSLKEAENPVFAVNFLIQNIDKCDTWWKSTCSRIK